MDAFVMEIAGVAFQVIPLYETTRFYCRDYLTDREPEYMIRVQPEYLGLEQLLLDWEADEEGLKRRKFPEPFLERSFIQRRVAEMLLERGVILMHGSTVAVDGQAYLFTAPCGTGKSTHTRLWREVFGDRAVMVNDDKPFLRFEEDAVLACGSPWTGKHGLGCNVSFPLRGICILHRGSDNNIQRADLSEVRDFLLHQCFIPEEGREEAIALAERLMKRVPIWGMECTKDHQAATAAWLAMNGMKE